MGQHGEAEFEQLEGRFGACLERELDRRAAGFRFLRRRFRHLVDLHDRAEHLHVAVAEVEHLAAGGFALLVNRANLLLHVGELPNKRLSHERFILEHQAYRAIQDTLRSCFSQYLGQFFSTLLEPQGLFSGDGCPARPCASHGAQASDRPWRAKFTDLIVVPMPRGWEGQSGRRRIQFSNIIRPEGLLLAR